MKSVYNSDEWKDLSDEDLQIKVMELIRTSKKTIRYHVDPDFRAQIHDLQDRLDAYQETWGTEIIRDFYYEIEMNAMFRRLDETYTLLRKNVLFAIKNSPDIEEFKEMALKMIKIEKEHGQFDPQNWPGIA